MNTLVGVGDFRTMHENGITYIEYIPTRSFFKIDDEKWEDFYKLIKSTDNAKRKMKGVSQ